MEKVRLIIYGSNIILSKQFMKLIISVWSTPTKKLIQLLTHSLIHQLIGFKVKIPFQILQMTMEYTFAHMNNESTIDPLYKTDI